MYCVQCGVKLADSQQCCPLCETPVYHPQIKQNNADLMFPENHHPPKPPHALGIPILATVAFLIISATVLISDLHLSHKVSWSGYVLGALITVYVSFIMPLWFRKPHPVVFVPCAFVCVILYLLYINLITHGSWFLSFAFPVAGGIGILVTVPVTLMYYLKKGYLFILGSVFTAFGAFLLLVEYLANFTFQMERFIGWSLYPLNVLVMLGLFLLFLGICPPAKKAMERLFFV